MTELYLKRVYDGVSAADGYKVLVDKLWPRGLTKAEVDYDYWAKDLAPSDELREWFHADREGRWDEFSRKYTAQLENSPAMKAFIERISHYPKVTLLYGSKDRAHNQADIIYSVASHLLSLIQSPT